MSVSLWEFAAACYQRPGVAELCLTLQDGADADINMLLAAAWLAADGHLWQIEDVAALVSACAQWRALCLLPLRKIRRDMKGLVGADNWYQRIKALELEAERHQLHRIEDAAPYLSPIAETNDRQAVIEHNLDTYLGTLPAIAAGRYRHEVALLIQLLSAN